MFSENQSYLDRLAYFITKFKPNLEKCILDYYERIKHLSNSPRPLDDSITLQELLQQMLCCGWTKEDLYKLVTNGSTALEISLV